MISVSPAPVAPLVCADRAIRRILPEPDRPIALPRGRFLRRESGRDVDKFNAEMRLHAREVDGFPAPARWTKRPRFSAAAFSSALPLGSHELFLCAVEDVYVKDALFDPDGSLHLGRAQSGQLCAR